MIRCKLGGAVGGCLGRGAIRRRFGGLLLVGCAAALACGCDSGPQLAPVSGRVTFNGEPLKFGSVMFQNVAGGQPAQGKIQPDGTFELHTFEPGDGAIVGTHRVQVACYTSQDPAAGKQQLYGEDVLGQLLIPRKYSMLGTSGITVEVPPEGNENVEIALTGSAP